MNNTSFTLHPQLNKDTFLVEGNLGLELCEARLMNDANYPWLILVPKRANIREMHALSVDEQLDLMMEITAVSEALQEVTGCDKINVGALGNMVPQLHIHIIARTTTDAAWPAPVWGKAPAVPYGEGEADALTDKLTKAMG